MFNECVGTGQNTGKTVAIILGGAAGVGFLVICMLFARNQMKKHDGKCEKYIFDLSIIGKLWFWSSWYMTQTCVSNLWLGLELEFLNNWGTKNIMNSKFLPWFKILPLAYVWFKYLLQIIEGISCVLLL